MIKLAVSSKIYFNHPKQGHAGWNTIGNLINVLGARLESEYPTYSSKKIAQEISLRLYLLQTNGFLTPDESLDDVWWIVEKVIPFDIREAFRKDEISRDDIIKQLKV